MCTIAQKYIDEGISQGISQGVSQGIKKTAINMLKQNCDIQFIARVTGLSIQDIQKLKASN